MIELFEIPAVVGRVTASPGLLASEQLVVQPDVEAGLVLFRVELSPGHRQVVHEDKTVLVYVLDGAGQIRSGEDARDVRAGSLVHIPPSTPHDFWASTEPLLLLYTLVLTSGSSPAA